MPQLLTQLSGQLSCSQHLSVAELADVLLQGAI
jgi:hypothetical protein